jgi:sialic acid synthase
MTMLIAELGQNMQGSLEVAKDMIRMCANPQRGDLFGEDVGGVDAVKMTKRSLAHELTTSAAAMPYMGDNAFGLTYGLHRAMLELKDSEHAECYRYAKSLGLDFIETICAPEALTLLDLFTPDSVKVASRDLTNLRLIDALAETKIPLILSTGMGGMTELESALERVRRHHEEITVLHCLSQYPAEPNALNLNTILWLKKRLPYRVGYSDHSEGVWAPIAAVALGAEVVEKHVTLDRTMRGTDHMGALERDGIWRWVRDTRMLEKALGDEAFQQEDVSLDARLKLARSVATRRELPSGYRIMATDLEPLSPGSGVPWPEHERLVGKWTIQTVGAQEHLTATMVKDK